MEPLSFTRRDLLGGLAALPLSAALAREQQPAVLKLANSALEFQIEIRGGKLAARELVNRLSRETVALPARDFAIEFEGGERVDSAGMEASVEARDATRIELAYAKETVTVRVQYELPAGKPYLRKRIRLKRDGQPKRVMLVELEDWQGVKRPWRSMRPVDRLPHGSHPIYCDTLWTGVEFAAAFNEYSGDGFLLRSRPGGKPAGTEWLALNSTVMGVAEQGQTRDAFLAYIDDIRLAPPRLVACYNTWWTYYANELTAEKYAALLAELKAKLGDRHGLFFDIVTTDEGWADKHSIWQIDGKKLPEGFTPLRNAVEAAGGKLGLWMSPSAVYPNSTDCDWAAQNGYVVSENDYRPGRRHPGLSLGQPRYREETKKQLARLIRENELRQIKYDGFIAREANGHDDLLPGDDSVEPLAHHLFELLDASLAANPEVFTEPTCLNSLANYISPWIIRHAHSVWGNSGGDCPRGINPAPDYRESHTNARELFIFLSMDEVWLPQNALQYFDIVHADEDPGFANHAAMAFGRGRFFVPTYINPTYMSEDDWRIYAGFLRWARRNQEILRHTKATPSKVELGEPYVYAHWLGTRGILVVRNPSNETRKFELELAKHGAPRGLANALCYSQYPYRKGFAAGLKRESSITLSMAPWETLFLEIVPRGELREPVALGARWFRGPKGEMLLAADSDAGEARLYSPRSGERALPSARRPSGMPSGEVTAHNVKPGPSGGVAFETECRVTIPDGAAGEALLLLQFPGREYRANACEATVNGQRVSLRRSSSDKRIGTTEHEGSRWKEVLPHLAEWSWHIAKVASGTSTVRFTGTAAAQDCRIGLWAWATEDLRDAAAATGLDCPERQLPPFKEEMLRRGVCLRQPA
ncbi:MAG: alpha-galactosidase [Bryobacteraceae bacterium]|nr:alpha-galactosidase [Bryobacteraceae bacterium]